MLAVCVCFCRYASLSASAVVIHYEEALYQVYDLCLTFALFSLSA